MITTALQNLYYETLCNPLEPHAQGPKITARSGPARCFLGWAS